MAKPKATPPPPQSPPTPDATTAPAAPKVKTARTKRFEMREVHRAEIKEALYNPRFIDKHAAKRLREHIQTVGLVQPLVWNARTGNLVGGHQRLGAMDEIEGTRNYMVPVAAIDVDEQREKELNVWLNNPATQGQWDLGKLESLFTEHGANPFASGFEKLDLELMFPLDTVEELLEKFAPEKEAHDAPGLPPDAVAEAKKVQSIKDRRKEYQAGARQAIRADHILVVVFETAEHAATTIAGWQLPEADTFVSADRFIDAMQAHYGPKGLVGMDWGVDPGAPEGDYTVEAPLPPATEEEATDA